MIAVVTSASPVSVLLLLLSAHFLLNEVWEAKRLQEDQNIEVLDLESSMYWPDIRSLFWAAGFTWC